MDATKHPFQLINAFLFFFHQDHKKKMYLLQIFTYLHFNFECFINFIIKLILLMYFRFMLLILKQEEKNQYY